MSLHIFFKPIILRAVGLLIVLGALGVFLSPREQAQGDSEEGQQLPYFEDVTAKAGITFKHSFGDDTLSNIVEGTGSGCMFLDYDGDGLLDIYLVNGRYHKDVNDNNGR